MQHIRQYDGIDVFRIIAAVLIVAIHTYPLLSINEFSNTLVVHVILRIAVPFFLMTTGYFLIPKLFLHKEAGFAPIRMFVIRTLVLYGIACVIYIPIAIYSGLYHDVDLVPTLLRNVLIDGTFYHLWYLPAAITAVLVVYGLSRFLSLRSVMMVSVILYIIALMGDSYYGIATQVPAIAWFYERLFTVITFTRNGFFYAPIFLMLGCVMFFQQKKYQLSDRTILIGGIISFVLLITEGILLIHVASPRHDASYISLIPLMYFLFLAIERKKGKRSQFLRDTSLWVYIIHPLMIIVLRGVARSLGLWGILVDNSVMRFVMVTIMSLIFAGILSYILDRRRMKQV